MLPRAVFCSLLYVVEGQSVYFSLVLPGRIHMLAVHTMHSAFYSQKAQG